MTANMYSDGAGAASAANRLKQALVDFATGGELGDEFVRQKKSTLRFKGALDEFEEALILDWFIFDWMDETGAGVIDRFLASHDSLSDQEQQMVVDWGSSIHNIFEICDFAGDRLTLRELDDGATLTVHGGIGSSRASNIESGRFLMARLLPVLGSFHFSGPQLLLPDREAALEALEMAQSLGVVVSPGEIEEAQADQRKGFIEFFGGPEVTINSSELDSALERFEKYLLFDRREPKASMTKAESFRAGFGVEVKMPSIRPRPRTVTDEYEITLLCDEFEGIILLPRYRDFRRTFESDDPDGAVSDWKNLMWTYIQDPDIPIVAFEYVAEKEPVRLERLLRVLLADNDFSLEHLYAMLLHYKEPVEGLDDLKDDEKLWDLLDGKQAGPNQPLPRTKASRKAPQSRRPATSATRSAKASKKRPASKKGPAPKRGAKKKSPASKKSASSKKSAPSKKSAASRTAVIKSQPRSKKRPATKKRTTRSSK